MTGSEMTHFLRDVARLATRTDAVIYEHVKPDGTIQLYLQPTRRVDAAAALRRKRAKGRLDA